MFITRSAYKSPVSGMFTSDDEQVWDATELALQTMWFVVNLEITDRTEEEFASNSTVLLADFKYVEPLLQGGKDGNTRLKSVHVVTPGHVNGSGNWQMERLRAVWQGREMVGDCAIPTDVFETTSGNRYPASFCGLSAEELAANDLKFQL